MPHCEARRGARRDAGRRYVPLTRQDVALWSRPMIANAMPADTVKTYQAYWALRAHLLAVLGRAEPAREAHARASALSEDVAVREFLAGRCSAIAPS
jgi:predicted RNA polymerase sigma factor